MMLALVVCLAMLRLGVWQLDRASQKQSILDQRERQSAAAPVNLLSLGTIQEQEYQFKPVFTLGRYLDQNVIYLDNQVLNGQVGYKIFSAFKPDNSDFLLMVDRGWLAAGDTREVLPKVKTSLNDIRLEGRLNKASGPAPLWDENYPVNDGTRWQYLDLSLLSDQLQQGVYPLVLELAPESAGDKALTRVWQSIDNTSVNKHKAYAFQWFSMAVAFLIACLIVLRKSRR